MVWVFSAVLYIRFLSQGRHLFFLSLISIIPIAILIFKVVKNDKTKALWILFTLTFLVVGDQFVGAYINNGWECRRKLLSTIEDNQYAQAITPLEIQLKNISNQYKLNEKKPGSIIPTIVCEQTVGSVHYMGVAFISAWMSLDLNQRILEANSDSKEKVSRSLIAVCYTSPEFPSLIIPQDQLKDYFPLNYEGYLHLDKSKVHILVSRKILIEREEVEHLYDLR